MCRLGYQCRGVTHYTDSDGLEERDPNPHVGDCHSCAVSIFTCVEQLQRQDAQRVSERDTSKWCAVLSSRGAQGEVPENQHMFEISAQPCVQSFPATSDASNNQSPVQLAVVDGNPGHYCCPPLCYRQWSLSIVATGTLKPILGVCRFQA